MLKKADNGRNKFRMEETGVTEKEVSLLIPHELINMTAPDLPDLSENEVIRHYTNLAARNYGVDNGMYPLGSCTMKYNPKINETISSMECFTNIHPAQDEADIQGSLQVMFELGEMLMEIIGLDAVTLQPSAGAHGEFCGLLIARKFFQKEKGRKKVIIPDSAHGTNFASAAMAGFEIIEIKSSKVGIIDIDILEKVISVEKELIAMVMITNPNTLGIFEHDILEISRLTHANGSLLYYDGANLNAIAGVVRPGDMGFDIVHLNLHKSFSAPHGGGGPGAGPVLVRKNLKDYLPVPIIEKKEGRYILDYTLDGSIGKIKSFFGNFTVCLKAYCYLLAVGSNLKEVSIDAILNANYLKTKLGKLFDIPYYENTMHEFVLSAKKYKEKGISALNIAKRLIDYGIHPPTIYFPAMVEEAMMIEPTETESINNLDNLINIYEKITCEAENDPDMIRNAPLSTKTARVDELNAVKNPVFKD